MREIKYKAYWHDSKLMTLVDTIEFLNGGTRVSDGCMHTGWAGEDCELVEYAGEKTEDGREIFEGQIVKCFTNSISTVEFKSGCFGLVTDGYFYPFCDIMGHCEILGNIFENPDLLGGIS